MIRTIRPGDLPVVKTIIDAVDLFPSEMMDDMIAPFFDDPDGDPFWLTCEQDGVPVAVAFGEPERMTDGTWNLLLIAVHPDHQSKGIGETVMGHVETMLARRGGRILLVETSGADAFARTRSFYDRIGYEQEARIRDYYAAGDDKIVFRKALAP